MKKFTIYKITNRKNGKSYIGQTRYDIEHRWKRHLSCARTGSKFRFHAAIRKYGAINWDLEELYTTFDYKDALEKEKHFIGLHKTNSCMGYNANGGGTGGWLVVDFESWQLKLTARVQGQNNPNWSGITDQELIDIMVDKSKSLGRIPSLEEVRRITNLKIPKSFSKNRFGGKIKNLYSAVEEVTGLKYNQFNKSPEHRKKLSEKTKDWVWINDGKENKRIRREDIGMYLDFKRGKCNVNKN